jgi:hypothetical protein
MAFKMRGISAFKNDEDTAYGVKKSDSISVNEHNEGVRNEELEFQKNYTEKHGSSSGGTDEEWNAYQNSLKGIRSKYIRE